MDLVIMVFFSVIMFFGILPIWVLAVSSRVLTAHVLTQFLIKKIVGLPNIKRRLVWQYIFCVLFSVVYAVVFGFNLSNSFWLIFVLGLLHSLGVYYNWQAVKISLSKTYIFTQADDLIAVVFGYILINETQYLNSQLVVGVLMCFGAGALMFNKTENRRLLKLVGMYSVIWGLCFFCFRWFALQKISFGELLIAWYVSNLIGVFGILIFDKEKITIKLKIKELSLIGILAFAVWFSMLLQYWIAYLAPITVYQPIFLITEMFFPVLIGMFFFKEAKTFHLKEKIALIIGLVGTIAIFFSYH